jgi:hypothetical protein
LQPASRLASNRARARPSVGTRVVRGNVLMPADMGCRRTGSRGARVLANGSEPAPRWELRDGLTLSLAEVGGDHLGAALTPGCSDGCEARRTRTLSHGSMRGAGAIEVRGMSSDFVAYHPIREAGDTSPHRRPIGKAVALPWEGSDSAVLPQSEPSLLALAVGKTAIRSADPVHCNPKQAIQIATRNTNLGGDYRRRARMVEPRVNASQTVQGRAGRHLPLGGE